MPTSFHPPQRTLMGHGCNLRNVLMCLSAFETVLASEGADVATGVAESAASERFGS